MGSALMPVSAMPKEFDAGGGRIVSVKSVEESIRAAVAIYHGGTLYRPEDVDNDPYCQMLEAAYDDCRIAEKALGTQVFWNSGFWEPNCTANQLHRLVVGEYGHGRLLDIYSYLRQVSGMAAGKRMGITPKMAERIIADYPYDPEDSSDNENPDGMFFMHRCAGCHYCGKSKMSLERHGYPGKPYWIVRDADGNVVAGLDRQIHNKKQAMDAARKHYYAPKITGKPAWSLQPEEPKSHK